MVGKAFAETSRWIYAPNCNSRKAALRCLVEAKALNPTANISSRHAELDLETRHSCEPIL
jgi:hypothetical protein